MKPVIALVGRPNVGKSTLFNKLTRSRDALVADQPGLTRDRQFGEGKLGPAPYIVVDTGGLSDEVQGVEENMAHQAWLAVDQADKVLFLVDAHAGLNAADQAVAQRLREAGKKVALVVNKVDGMEPELAASEFYALGFEQVFAIAASQGRGVKAMMDTLLDELPADESGEDEAEHGIKVAIVGRPNVGKSTLVNRLLGEERVVTFDLPGTTRDSLYLPFERDGQRFTLIDTAGVRRRSRIDETIEKYSVIKSLRAIEDAHVVIMLLDASEGISEQDAHLLGFVLEAGRALVLGINKWDGLDTYQRDTVRRELDRRLQFVSFAEVFFISALHGTAVGDLIPAVQRAYESAMKDMSTPELTRVLEDLVTANPPPLVKGRRIKLRYAHQGGQNPPLVVIHGNQTAAVPANYQRYLVNAIRKHFKLVGTPLRIQFKSGDNPYAGKRNKLTKRQLEKRRRLKRHVKNSGR